MDNLSKGLRQILSITVMMSTIVTIIAAANIGKTFLSVMDVYAQNLADGGYILDIWVKLFEAFTIMTFYMMLGITTWRVKGASNRFFIWAFAMIEVAEQAVWRAFMFFYVAEGISTNHTITLLMITLTSIPTLYFAINYRKCSTWFFGQVAKFRYLRNWAMYRQAVVGVTRMTIAFKKATIVVFASQLIYTSCGLLVRAWTGVDAQTSIYPAAVQADFAINFATTLMVIGFLAQWVFTFTMMYWQVVERKNPDCRSFRVSSEDLKKALYARGYAKFSKRGL